jgi:hypothetical protein
MKQEQLIAYSLILFIVIPLLITTLGGMMILSGSVEFFPYAKFLFSLTISLGLLLFTLKNFKVLYGWLFIFLISFFHSYSLRHSFLFEENHLIVNWLLIFVFFAGLVLCIKYIFLNKNLRSVRTLLFSIAGAVVFTGIFTLLLKITEHPLNKYMFFSDFSMGFMLFATIGIGFLITDIVLNAIANHYHLMPDLLTILPDQESDDELKDNESTDDDPVNNKEEDDQDPH